MLYLKARVSIYRKMNLRIAVWLGLTVDDVLQ